MNDKYILANNIELEAMGISEDDDFMVLASDIGKVLIVNNSTAEVMKLLSEPHTADSLVAHISKQYAVDDKLIRKDIENILESLVKMKVLHTYENSSESA